MQLLGWTFVGSMSGPEHELSYSPELSGSWAQHLHAKDALLFKRIRNQTMLGVEMLGAELRQTVDNALRQQLAAYDNQHQAQLDAAMRVLVPLLREQAALGTHRVSIDVSDYLVGTPACRRPNVVVSAWRSTFKEAVAGAGSGSGSGARTYVPQTDPYNENKVFPDQKLASATPPSITVALPQGDADALLFITNSTTRALQCPNSWHPYNGYHHFSDKTLMMRLIAKLHQRGLEVGTKFKAGEVCGNTRNVGARTQIIISLRSGPKPNYFLFT